MGIAAGSALARQDPFEGQNFDRQPWDNLNVDGLLVLFFKVAESHAGSALQDRRPHDNHHESNSRFYEGLQEIDLLVGQTSELRSAAQESSAPVRHWQLSPCEIS